MELPAGIETLPLRMERHCDNALALAKHLKGHSGVEWVRYPSLDGDKNQPLAEKYLQGKGGSMGLWHQGRQRGR